MSVGARGTDRARGHECSRDPRLVQIRTSGFMVQNACDPVRTMQHVSFDVETLSCEASASDILDELLAHDGVTAARVDLEGERIVVSVDDAAAVPGSLEATLDFLGLAVVNRRVDARGTK